MNEQTHRTTNAGAVHSIYANTPPAVILDTNGNPLEVGAMYCCTLVEMDGSDNEYEMHGNLVRYVGAIDGRDVFADADDWNEIDCEFDKLIRQAGPVIDPATKGWGSALN